MDTVTQQPAMPHVEVRNEETRYLKCTLTDDELAHKSAELAARMGALEDREVEAKEAAAKAKRAIDAEKSALLLLARQVRERQENRAVGVYERWNYTDGIVETVREDTRDVLDTRRMAYDEQHPQQALPLATADEAEGVVDAQLAGEGEIPAGDGGDDPSDDVSKARNRRGTARLHEVH